LYSATIKVHPDGTGARQTVDRSFKRGLTTKIDLATRSAKAALASILTGGNVHDAPVGRELLDSIFSKTVN
jgi:hypothetical protein